MKRFLAFGGEHYHPEGGWDDLRGDFDTLEGAIASLSAQGYGAGASGLWSHIADTETGQRVWENYVPKNAVAT